MQFWTKMQCDSADIENISFPGDEPKQQNRQSAI